MAIAVNWNSRVDLDLNFDEFFDKDFTIGAWFMAQFPDSYINPIIGAGLPSSDQLFDPAKLAFFVMGTGSTQSRPIRDCSCGWGKRGGTSAPHSNLRNGTILR